MAILLLWFVILFLKRYYRTILEPMPMTPLLTLMLLIVAFGAEVGWLCRC
jgi:hypothetical protein